MNQNRECRMTDFFQGFCPLDVHETLQKILREMYQVYILTGRYIPLVVKKILV